jgi:hypothetical protein
MGSVAVRIGSFGVDGVMPGRSVANGAQIVPVDALLAPFT